MFVNILAYSPISDPLRLWKANWQFLPAEIENLFNDIGKSLKDFATMPFPSEFYFSNAVNRLLQEETSYDKEELKILHEKNRGMLNPEQKNVYDSIIQNVYNKVSGVFFIYGSGGCGKTFLWQTLCCRLRSEGKIVLPVASYGIAAVLFPGGRTAHSRFHIPLKLDQDITAGIRHGTDITELIQQIDSIIWDEAPMKHRHAFESVDHSLRDIMSAIDKRREKKPFGGITVVFGGDYRQILPVIPKASRAEVVGSTLNKSNIWKFHQVFLLKQNMRLHAGNTEMENKVIADFSKWQLLVGDGKVENFSPDADTGEMLIKIPDQYVVHTTQNPIESLFEITYPDFLRNMSSHSYLRSRAILTPTNIVVDDINNIILEKIPGTLHTYYSQDSIDDAGDEDNEFRSAFPVEYLNSLNMPYIPKHELNIKVDVVAMLMRNLNQIMGLCNGT
ncbi:ATP-dependent DNA helicase PIF1-like [Apium graveolens]|uniref:ATP-dependent DNA helicase PIF1-like n=1 Tax=Apium graveolens TaxID=4045 RepID=UPI003D7B22BF